uniref:LDLRAD1-like C-terminal domain-containing protein n=1 Tax=Callorhinchus milii TaxID=7868 RepID=A0A4W3IJ58_CALMI|eukprot:gi/632980662/ref/XP_007907159.1/ PREDICTED: low-density lipoprotein receptor class A domain-containing protein 1 [Callorhinchus milii]
MVCLSLVTRRQNLRIAACRRRMKWNQTVPEPSTAQRSFDGMSLGSSGSMAFREKGGRGWGGGCSRLCWSITGLVLLLLGLLGAAVVCGILFGIPLPTAAQRFCATVSNTSGFLCDDRVTCLQPSQVCDRARGCVTGEDEDPALCGNLPHSLPVHLLFLCGDAVSWIYADKVCDGFNNCGDCSDESFPLSECGGCGPQQWSCQSVFYQFCGCVPRALCQDGIQHCTDWSDEYICQA